MLCVDGTQPSPSFGAAKAAGALKGVTSYDIRQNPDYEVAMADLGSRKGGLDAVRAAAHMASGARSRSAAATPPAAKPTSTVGVGGKKAAEQALTRPSDDEPRRRSAGGAVPGVAV